MSTCEKMRGGNDEEVAMKDIEGGFLQGSTVVIEHTRLLSEVRRGQRMMYFIWTSVALSMVIIAVGVSLGFTQPWRRFQSNPTVTNSSASASASTANPLILTWSLNTTPMWADFTHSGVLGNLCPGAQCVLSDTQTTFIASTYKIVSLEKCFGIKRGATTGNKTETNFIQATAQLKKANTDIKVWPGRWCF